MVPQIKQTNIFVIANLKIPGKKSNFLLVRVDIPSDSKRLVRISFYPSKVDLVLLKAMDFEDPPTAQILSDPLRSSPILSKLPFSKSHLSSLDGGRLQNQQGHIPAETHLADPGIVLREDHHHGLFHDIIPHGTENGTGCPETAPRRQLRLRPVKAQLMLH